MINNFSNEHFVSHNRPYTPYTGIFSDYVLETIMYPINFLTSTAVLLW